MELGVRFRGDEGEDEREQGWGEWVRIEGVSTAYCG